MTGEREWPEQSGAWKALGTAAVRLLSVSVRVATSPFTNRALGAVGRGELSVVDNASATFATLCAPNVAASFFRTLGSQRFTYAEYAGTALILGLSFGLLVPIAFATSYLWLADSAYRGVTARYFALGFAACPFLLCRNYLHALLNGLGALREANRVVRNEAMWGLAITTFLLLFGVFRTDTALESSIAVALLGLANLFVLLRRRVSGPWRFSAHLFFVCLRDSVKVHLSAVATFLLLRIDVLMLNTYASIEQVGSYFVAVNAAETLLLIPYGTQAVLFSRSVEARVGDDGITSILRGTRHTLYWMLMGAAFLAVGAPRLIAILGGPSFHDAEAPLRLLLPGLVCYGVSMSLAPLWIRHGMYGMQSSVALVCLVLNVGLNVLLIPPMGISGAALASTAAYSTGGLIWLWILGRTIRIGPWDLFRLRGTDVVYYRDLWREMRSEG